MLEQKERPWLVDFSATAQVWAVSADEAEGCVRDLNRGAFVEVLTVNLLGSRPAPEVDD